MSFWGEAGARSMYFCLMYAGVLCDLRGFIPSQMFYQVMKGSVRAWAFVWVGASSVRPAERLIARFSGHCSYDFWFEPSGRTGKADKRTNEAKKKTREEIPGLTINGADDGVRTRDPNLGKVVLYQLSHIRIYKHPQGVKNKWWAILGSNQ